MRLWPHAAEDKSRTAFLAPHASMVLSTLMTLRNTVGGRLWMLFRGEPIIPEGPLGAIYPVEPGGGHIPRAFATFSTTWCELFARWGVAAALPGRTPPDDLPAGLHLR